MKKLLLKILLPFTILFACLGFAACDKESAILSAPQNLRAESEMLYWDGVEYAEGYTVVIDGKAYTATENKFDLSGLNNRNTYRITVRAFNQNGANRSDPAEIVYEGKCAVPTPGLEYKIISGKKEYAVTKFAVDENGTCIIPSTYRGQKVTSISPDPEDPAVEKVKHLYLPHTIDDSAFHLDSVKNNFKKFCNLETIDLEKKDENDQYVSKGNCIVNQSVASLSVGCIGSVIPEGVKLISYDAFSGANVKSVALPDSVVSIYNRAFADCSLLSEIKFSATLEAIAFSAFKNCTSLSEISLPATLKQIMASAFAGCSALRLVEIPDSVTDAGTATFRGCTSLKSAKLSEGMTTIDSGLFSGCSSLTEIMIPRKIANIKGNAFENCPLAEIFYKGTQADWNKIEIVETGNEALFSATLNYYSEEAPTEAGNYWHYVDGVPTKWTYQG